MKPIHAVATALVAILALALSAPAQAAPKGDPAAPGWAGHVVQVDHDDDDDDGGRRWRHRDRDDDWRWRRDRRSDWRDHRGRRFDWDRGRGPDRRWSDDRWKNEKWSKKRQKKWAKERRKWEKQRRKWAKERRREWAREHRRWQARQHPRHPRWVGQPFRHDRYSVLRDFDRYRLPPPWRGQFYAQSGDEIFLVDEATRMILNAFVFSDAFRR